MNNRILIKAALFLSISIFTLASFSQSIESQFAERGERYFSFKIISDSDLIKLARIISIDRIDGDSVIANASLEEFKLFLSFDIDYTLLPHPAELIEDVALAYDEIENLNDWNFYPTYGAYVAMMNDFETNYPAICTIHNIGTLPSGRQLLTARISKNVGEPGDKPRFLYTATMHGDELTGYVHSLQLIDYLLSNYGSNDRVTRLVDSVDIWINPNANPDGTYYAGNHTISGARRRNANNVDLNRNYPDPAAGPNPDGNAWQPETVFFMEFAEQYKFNISSNWHGGAEVCNYPWDTWAHLTADNSWWVYTMREYADTVHAYSPPPYFRGFNAGITNGYAWYSITGGRQDYMNYFQHCREFTLELTNAKIPPAAQLPNFWNYNYRSYLNYIEQSLYGIRGTVSNSVTGAPVQAKVEISGHDTDNSFVYSSADAGNYHRYLAAGTYSLTFSALCYETVTISNVSVSNRTTTWLDVEMTALPLLADFEASSTAIEPGQQTSFTDMSCGNITGRSWYFDGGNPMVSNSVNPSVTYADAGLYDVMLVVNTANGSDTIIKHDYIRVGPAYNMANATHTTCLGNFYDSGGPNNNYGNNENFTLTFLPSIVGGKIEVDFLHFDLEFNANCSYDWLKLYDGTNTSSSLIGTYCGTDSPGHIVATNESGALTFQFKSDNSVTKSGWKASISCEPPAMNPIADFEANITHITEGDTIIFSNLSAGFPTENQWHFEGGTPAGSTLKNPMVIYSLPGVYPVTLEVSNAYGSDSKTMQNYIQVDEGVGMARFHENIYLNAYPNPVVHGILQLVSDSELGNVELFSLMGQKMISNVFKSKKASLDLSDFPKGVYLLKVRNEKGIAVKKIHRL
jgi:PKD repeat protein